MTQDLEQETLADRLDQALLHLNLENQQLEKTIRSLLHRSVDYGRAERVLGQQPTDEECLEYVKKVVSFYPEHHVFVICLEKREEEAWRKAIQEIRRWANSYLRNRNIDGTLKDTILEACIPNAVIAYLNSVYHFDVDFDAWFCVLVQNVCRKYIKDELKDSREIERTAQSIDKVDFTLSLLADNKELETKRLREMRSELLEAVKKLSSEARQELIILKYFQGYSYPEISERMGKSMTAVYKLNHDALKELRAILGDSWQ